MIPNIRIEKFASISGLMPNGTKITKAGGRNHRGTIVSSSPIYDGYLVAWDEGPYTWIGAELVERLSVLDQVAESLREE